MATVKVKYKSGLPTTPIGGWRIFEDRGRPGGSYTQKLSTDGPFAVVTDCYGTKTYIPSTDIEEIVVDGEGNRY